MNQNIEFKELTFTFCGIYALHSLLGDTELKNWKKRRESPLINAIGFNYEPKK